MNACCFKTITTFTISPEVTPASEQICFIYENPKSRTETSKHRQTWKKNNKNSTSADATLLNGRMASTR